MQYEGNILRHELKYYINESVYHTLRERFLTIVGPDPNMKKEEGYLITSVYFDDMFCSAEKEKIAGARFRKKFRIRSYERDDSFMRLECKSKFDEYISKTSAVLSREEYDRIMQNDLEFLLQRKERVCQELFGYNRTRLLKPKVAVEYLREAYISPLGNVRLTFDKDISASLGTPDMFDERFITAGILPEHVMVLEVKYDDYLPDFVKTTLRTAMTEKCAVSKYVMCAQKMRSMRIGG